MHDEFWSKEGRKRWHEPEPGSKIFLARLFVEFGQIRYGTKWAGTTGKPSAKTADPLKTEIAQAAASGQIQTFVLNPQTFEFQLIERRGWRNPKALAARFSRCRIDASDPVSNAAEGHHHGEIFVDLDSAKTFLDAKRTNRFRPGNLVSLNHVSTYVRYMIFIAQKARIDERNPPNLKVLQGQILDEWDAWRLGETDNKSLPNEAEISDTMAHNMATLLRGELARIEKGGGVRKKIAPPKNSAITKA